MFTGTAGVRKMYEMATRIYDDGTPKTKHNTSNVQLEDRRARVAPRAACRITASPKPAPNLALQVIVDRALPATRFTGVDGVWWFDSRTMFVDQVGDVSQHLKF